MKEEMTFEVHPSVIFKLGEDLITDDYQALVELVKNSYDADASGAVVKIHTDKYFVFENNHINEVETNMEGAIRGIIEIQDNGCGMSVDIIKNGWLTISSSHKRSMKEHGEKTKKGRTPLGDKGLGRLGAQRLGKVLVMQTKRENAEILQTTIDWSRFDNNEVLSSIPINVETVTAGTIGTEGTVIRIYGLRVIESWKQTTVIQDKFSEIISPYSDKLGFSVSLYIDDSEVDLREQSQLALDNSGITYHQKYQEGVLVTTGAFGITYLDDLRTHEKREQWERLIVPDNGKAFFDWLKDKEPARTSAFKFEYCDDRKFCRFEFAFQIEDIPNIERHTDNVVFDPGNYSGRIDYIRRDDLPKPAGAASAKALMDAIKGVRVYRDGFGIKLKESIFPFAAQWTNAKSYYTLQPENVVGYINISTTENACLEETTNREEFQDNAYFRNFQRLLSAWLTRTEEAQSLLRKGYNEYKRFALSESAGIGERSTPRELADSIVAQIDSFGKAMPTGSLFDDEAINGELDALKSKKAAVQLLVGKAEEANEQLQDAWGLVALGIVAETVAHEISNIAGRIDNSSAIIMKTNNVNYHDTTIRHHSELVRIFSKSLIKEVSHLNPSLKYVRERKEKFSLLDLINQCVEYFETRLEQGGIKVLVDLKKDATVVMNKGKLLQVLDNLIINSEYWLRSALKSKQIDEACINFEVSGPYIIVFDNGRGIDKSVENTLFDPFVTRKPRETGRGLGLFVSRQLLEPIGAAITLDAERNVFGNRYKFRIDLSNVEGGK